MTAFNYRHKAGPLGYPLPKAQVMAFGLIKYYAPEQFTGLGIWMFIRSLSDLNLMSMAFSSLNVKVLKHKK